VGTVLALLQESKVRQHTQGGSATGSSACPCLHTNCTTINRAGCHAVHAPHLLGCNAALFVTALWRSCCLVRNCMALAR
jgi:hypothetical protein